MPTHGSHPDDQALQRRLVDRWIEHQHSPNTKAAYRADLKTFDEWCVVQGTLALRADSAAVGAFTSARELAGDSAATLRRRWSSLSSFFDFAIHQRATHANPLKGLVRPPTSAGNPSPTGLLSEQAVARYRARAAAIDPRLDAIVALLVADGLKLGEALALDIDDLTGRPPTVTVSIHRRGQPTIITLDAASATAVVRCVGRRRHGPVFLSGAPSADPPRRLTRFGADHLVRQLSHRHEPRVTTNELRRFHITNSISDNDLVNARDRAGLASIRSVQRYLIVHDLPPNVPNEILGDADT